MPSEPRRPAASAALTESLICRAAEQPHLPLSEQVPMHQAYITIRLGYSCAYM
jgi:hypothetical protein